MKRRIATVLSLAALLAALPPAGVPVTYGSPPPYTEEDLQVLVSVLRDPRASAAEKLGLMNSYRYTDPDTDEVRAELTAVLRTAAANPEQPDAVRLKALQWLRATDWTVGENELGKYVRESTRLALRLLPSGEVVVRELVVRELHHSVADRYWGYRATYRPLARRAAAHSHQAVRAAGLSALGACGTAGDLPLIAGGLTRITPGQLSPVRHGVEGNPDLCGKLKAFLRNQARDPARPGATRLRSLRSLHLLGALRGEGLSELRQQTVTLVEELMAAEDRLSTETAAQALLEGWGYIRGNENMVYLRLGRRAARRADRGLMAAGLYALAFCGGTRDAPLMAARLGRVTDQKALRAILDVLRARPDVAERLRAKLIELAGRPALASGLRLSALAAIAAPYTEKELAAAADLYAALRRPYGIACGSGDLLDYVRARTDPALAVPCLIRMTDGNLDLNLNNSYAAHPLRLIRRLLAEAKPETRTEIIAELPARAVGRFFAEGRDNLRAAAYGLLKDLGPHAAPALPAIAGLLQSPERPLRGQAVRLLGSIGPAARAALPALEQALEDKSESVRKEAAEALRKIRGERPAPGD